MAGRLLKHVPLGRNLRVLDVGCSTGFPLLELAQRLGPTCAVVGLDPREEKESPRLSRNEAYFAGCVAAGFFAPLGITAAVLMKSRFGKLLVR